MADLYNQKIAWMIPCLNEEVSIAKVIQDIQLHAPNTEIHVFDNSSTDSTAIIAKKLNATVHLVPEKGKGNVVRRMFETVEADVYIIIDGDDSYRVADWQKIIGPVLRGEADMIVGCRTEKPQANANRRFHSFGNVMITSILNFCFRRKFRDVLSGYRGFSQRFVKGVALNAKGFEIEADLTIQALENNFRVIEVATSIGARPPGSFSKLRTFQDGFLILWTILKLFKDYKPLTFFGLISLFLLSASVVCFVTPGDFAERGSSFFAIASLICGATGIILNSISQRHKEIRQILIKQNQRQLPESEVVATIRKI